MSKSLLASILYLMQNCARLYQLPYFVYAKFSNHYQIPYSVYARLSLYQLPYSVYATLSESLSATLLCVYEIV